MPKNRFLLLLISLFLLCACGQQMEAVTTPPVETAGAQTEITQPQAETLLSTEVKESPAQTLAESSTQVAEESMTQAVKESVLFSFLANTPDSLCHRGNSEY